MPIEYNLSHEDTVIGWDKISKETEDVFNLVIKDIKKNHNYKKEIKTVQELNEIIHKILEQNIDIQEEQNNFDVILKQKYIEIDRDNMTFNFKKIISYCILSLYILNNLDGFSLYSIFDTNDIWKEQININRKLMIDKNKNYGSSWSIMRSGTITDVIHTKIHRIISLLEGTTNKFESLKDNFEDIINYCIFCIMRIELEKIKTYEQK